jgi:hypothetical protein
MKNKLLIFFLLLIAGGLNAADLRPFPFCRELQPPAAAGELAGVTLDRPIYAAAASLPANLRIGDQDNREIPFQLRVKAPAKATLREIPLPAEVLSFRELPDNRVEIIAGCPDRPASLAGLRIHSPKRNFEKQVTVFASPDREKWQLLAEAVPVFDYSRFIDVRNDRITFAPGNYRYFKIEVANITETNDSPLTEIIRKRSGKTEIETTEINSIRKEPFRMDRLDILEQQETFLPGEIETREDAVGEWTTADDAERHLTVLTFAGYREPITELILATQESNFSRPVTVAGADSPKGPWTDLAAGRISRIDAGKVHQQALTIPLNGERRYRHFRLSIENQDNPPLTITGIRARQNLYEVIFFPKPGDRYRLYYGGSNAPLPVYDIETVLQALPPGAAPAWTMGAEQPNPEFKPGAPPPAYDGKKLLIAAIVIMVGVLAGALIWITKKIGPTPE